MSQPCSSGGGFISASRSKQENRAGLSEEARCMNQLTDAEVL